MRNKFLILAFCLLLCSCSANTAEAPQTGSESIAATETTTEASAENTTATATESQTETTTTAELSETEPETEAETEPAEECHCEFDWQHAYAEYINDLNFYMGLYIDDINGDDIPEAVIKRNDTLATMILYYTENGLAEFELQPVSDWGHITYIPDTKQILFSPFYGHTYGTWGYEEYYLYDWTGTEYTETFSIFREAGAYANYVDLHIEEYGQAYINGEEVDNDTFEAKFAEIKELESANSYFPVVNIKDENFESYVKEKLPDFKMPEFNY